MHPRTVLAGVGAFRDRPLTWRRVATSVTSVGFTARYPPASWRIIENAHPSMLPSEFRRQNSGCPAPFGGRGRRQWLHAGHSGGACSASVGAN